MELVMRWLFVLYSKRQVPASADGHSQLAPRQEDEQHDEATGMDVDTVPGTDTALQAVGQAQQLAVATAEQEADPWTGTQYETVLLALLEGLRWVACLSISCDPLSCIHLAGVVSVCAALHHPYSIQMFMPWGVTFHNTSANLQFRSFCTGVTDLAAYNLGTEVNQGYIATSSVTM
jgi:hypothetical protein